MASFQVRILDVDANVLDTDDAVFSAEQIDAELLAWNAEPVVCGGCNNPRVEAYAVDMADGSRGFIQIIGVAE